MALERVYNIPLRKEFLNAPRHKRAKRSVSALKKFLEKHMKSADIKIGKHLNNKIWAHGIKNPPHHVLVQVTKDDKGVVNAELVGAPVDAQTKSGTLQEGKKKEDKKGKKEKKTEEAKKEEPEKKQEKKEEPKKEEAPAKEKKEEVKEKKDQVEKAES